MKLFNLSEALAGKPVVTRDGRKVTELHHFKTANEPDRIIAVIGGVAIRFYEEGNYLSSSEHENDLFMAPETVTKWINIYDGHDGYYGGGVFYNTEKEAKKNGVGKVVATSKITFEI